MDDDLPDILEPGDKLPAEVQEAAESLREYLDNSLADATRRAYQYDWSEFERWCQRNGLDAMPADPRTVALFFAHLGKAGRAVSSIERKKSAIKAAHKAANQPPPTDTTIVEKALSGIRRTHGTKPEKKAGFFKEHLVEVREHVDLAQLIDLRDWAILAVGFVTGMRRSEIAGMHVEHIFTEGKDRFVWLPHSKTDQEGEGDEVIVPFASERRLCPVRALEDWLNRSGIEAGPVWRSIDRWGNVLDAGIHPQSVSKVVKRWVKAIGENPDDYGGHSLRRGFITEADSQGYDFHSVRLQTRHKRRETHDGYVQRNNMSRDAPRLL